MRRSLLKPVRTFFEHPVDLASLAFFRILFGLLMFAGCVRFLQMGWVERFYEQPNFFFTYWGFAWIPTPPPGGVYVCFIALMALSLLIAFGLCYRVAIAGFFVLFTYIELLDVTNYLNHYYLVSLLALVMNWLPLHRGWSLDARRRPRLAATTAPAWTLYLVRFQVGLVYFYAAVAKMGADWLIHGQPLNLWLSARTDTPLIGALFDEPWIAIAFSWAGFLHDLAIVPLLLWKRTRLAAYFLLTVFHVATGILFNIGMFPFLMTSFALIFFPPSWPRPLLRWVTQLLGSLAGNRAPISARETSSGPSSSRASRLRVVRGRRLGAAIFGYAVVGAYCLAQVALPLRSIAYGGNVLWHEQGMRFAWKVMVREKSASLIYRVRLDGSQREIQVSPRRYLTERQEREMASQPDLILQLAHRIAGDFRARGARRVEVRADAFASLNGRLAERLIDPGVDLARVRDGLGPASWILSAPSSPPPLLRPPRSLQARTES